MQTRIQRAPDDMSRIRDSPGTNDIEGSFGSIEHSDRAIAASGQSHPKSAEPTLRHIGMFVLIWL